MLRRVLVTALGAGLIAGVFGWALQSVAVFPLIVDTERYETAAVPSPESASGATAGPWAPAEGMERAIYTLLANVLTGVGFGLLLAGCFILFDGAVDWRRGLLWGLGGFVAFAAAPALGLPPEPPGGTASEIAGRQFWWLGATMATAIGLGLMALARPRKIKALGIVLLVLPHLIGAPYQTGGGDVPAELVGNFIVASLVSTGLFWLALGGVSGFFYRRLGNRDLSQEP